MDIIITGFIGLTAGLAAGLVLGAMLWGHYADTLKAQAEEIDALQSDNLRLRGQASELATLADEGQAQACGARSAEELTERLMQQAESMLASEIDAHTATKRKLSAAKGQITKLRRMV